MRKHILLAVLCLLPLAAVPDERSADEEQLVTMLDVFLASSHTRAAHERFWADELVYTSSSGSRFGKADILDGFANEASREEPAVVYSGEDVDVRIYGSSAVVAFRLVGTPVDESADAMYYYNTGTFVKHGDEWRAVAWQATRIPVATDARD